MTVSTRVLRFTCDPSAGLEHEAGVHEPGFAGGFDFRGFHAHAVLLREPRQPGHQRIEGHVVEPDAQALVRCGWLLDSDLPSPLSRAELSMSTTSDSPVAAAPCRARRRRAAARRSG